MITAGVDIGSLSGDVVVLKDNQIMTWSVVQTGPDSAETAIEAMEKAMKRTSLKLEDIDYIVSTGYGRVVVPFAHKDITEISCHAKGANWFFPKVRTILDMGGQDCKAIRCNETGKVTNFVMNDKCAAGTGRFMEIIAETLEVELNDLGKRSLEIVEKQAVVSSMCAVFAKTEVISLVRQGKAKNDILAGACEAIASRVAGLMQRVGTEDQFVITGGIAKNIGVVKRIEEKLKMKAHIAFEPQIVGALGAAVFAQGILAKHRGAMAAAKS